MAETTEVTAADWRLMERQLDAMRAFWRLRTASPGAERVSVCGEVWLADYGPLPCARPHGHGGLHRCYGSQGPIDFGPALAEPGARETPHV